MSDNRDFIYTIPQRILFDRELTFVDKQIYMIIRSFMDTTGKATFASNKWIAEKLNIDPRSVPRSISRLIKAGHINRSGANKRYLSINFSPLPEGQVSCSEHDPSVTPPMTLVSPPHDPSVTLLYQSNINSKAISTAQENKISAINKAFSLMWEVYPLKKAKQEALKALKKAVDAVPEANQEELLHHICSGFASFMGERSTQQQLIDQGADLWLPELPYLSTWLNNARWKDEYQRPEQILANVKHKRGVLDSTKLFN